MIRFTSNLKFLLFLSILASFSLNSCKKAEIPELGSHKFTYYIETDGLVSVVYTDAKGTVFSETISNKKWHKTFNVKIGDRMHFEYTRVYGCQVGYYFAQDGRITHQQKLTYGNANYGIKASLEVRELY